MLVDFPPYGIVDAHNQPDGYDADVAKVLATDLGVKLKIALAAQADWVLPGLAEGQLLTGLQRPEDIARFYLSAGAKLVIIKLGAGGAYYDNGREQGEVDAVPVARIVDTVGAGDGFAVGVISSLLEGDTVARAVARGAWIGARAVQVMGDTEGLPTREVLRAAGL
ncbi:2-dehydro-3-deoxygluconokinase [Castellaniella defragrans]